MKKIVIIFGMAMLMAGCSPLASTDSSSTDEISAADAVTPAEEKPVVPKIVKMDNGLEYEIVKEGTDPAAAVGDNLVMHYTGFLTDGTKFDSSVDRGDPFHFTLGGGQVIEGWDTGIVGMKIGEQRKLTIPANLGYGEMAIGAIPANSVLIFDVELLENRGTSIR